MAKRNEDEVKAKEDIKEAARRTAVEKEIAAAADYRQHLTAARQAADRDAFEKLRRKGITIDREGNESNLWDKLKQKIDEVIHSEQHAYNDWRSAMMSLLNLFKYFVEAASHSIDVAVAPTMMAAKQGLRDKLLIPTKDKILDMLRGDPRVDLPALIHNVSLADDGRLNLGTLHTANNDELKGDSVKGLKTLVTLWLHEQGYELAIGGAEEGKYVTIAEPRTMLTKERFNELKNDNDKGLNSFLEKTLELDVSPRPSP